jgi:8-oxo-dGTP diphosphatase
VRGLARRLALVGRTAPDWLGTAWWGLVRARYGEPVEVVQAVVRRGDEVLLSRRRDLRGWELPGGNPIPGESPEQALRREVFEETGIDVEVGPLCGVYRRTGFLPHRARVYHCRPLGGVLRPSQETPQVAWCSAAALPVALLPWCRAPLADALRAAPGAAPVERTEHQGLRDVWAAARIDLAARLRGQ